MKILGTYQENSNDSICVLAPDEIQFLNDRKRSIPLSNIQITDCEDYTQEDINSLREATHVLANGKRYWVVNIFPHGDTRFIWKKLPKGELAFEIATKDIAHYPKVNKGPYPSIKRMVWLWELDDKLKCNRMRWICGDHFDEAMEVRKDVEKYYSLKKRIDEFEERFPYLKIPEETYPKLDVTVSLADHVS